MDANLEFLKNCTTQDLRILVDYLVRDKDGDTRWTESMTSTVEYRKYYPDDLPQMVELIDKEFREYGGNSLANFFRGEGPSYKEVLCDVCDKMDVNYNKNSEVAYIEMEMLKKILLKSAEKMNEEELKEMLKNCGGGDIVGGKEILVAALQTAIKIGGFSSYTIAVTVANSVAKAILGRGLTFAGNAALTRGLAIFAGPIGWIITALWTVIDIAGPAYRVTIPACIQIAYMRVAKQEYLE